MGGNYSEMPIYKRSMALAARIHEMTLKLPRFEMYEEGSQIRRSAKSIPANLAEGYGRRKYKNEYIYIVKWLLDRIGNEDEKNLKKAASLPCLPAMKRSST